MKIALAIIVLMFVAAAAFVIVGIHLLAGVAWAFIGTGVLLFGAAVYLRSGLSAHV